MVGVRCTCLATSTWSLLRPPDSTGPGLLDKEQVVLAQRNAVPLLSKLRPEGDLRSVQTNAVGFSDKSRDWRFDFGFADCTSEDDPSTTSGQQTKGQDSVVGSPSYLRRSIIGGSVALAVCASTGKAESLQEPSSTNSPPSSVNGSTSSNTDSWYRYKGQGFVVRVPPDFEDLLEPEETPDDDDSSLYGKRAKEQPFAARFASVDRKEVLSIVVKPVSQFKLAFLEAQDITALGTLEDAAKVFIPVGARVIGARSTVSKDDKTYYLYEFTTQDKRVALVAGAAGGQLYVAGAMAPQDRWRTSAAKLRLAALSFSIR